MYLKNPPFFLLTFTLWSLTHGPLPLKKTLLIDTNHGFYVANHGNVNKDKLLLLKKRFNFYYVAFICTD